MAKNKWSLMVAVFIIAIGPDCGSEDENDQSSNNGQAGRISYPYQCPEGSAQYTTSSGKTVCCAADNAQFCDENAEGYPGGCWPVGTACDTITECGGQYSSCPPETLPYCNNDQLQCFECSENASVHYTASGKPFCCGVDFPTFCDENQQGYPGGCWQAGVDCRTVVQCEGTWAACGSGLVVLCDTNTGEHFCVRS